MESLLFSVIKHNGGGATVEIFEGTKNEMNLHMRRKRRKNKKEGIEPKPYVLIEESAGRYLIFEMFAD